MRFSFRERYHGFFEHLGKRARNWVETTGAVAIMFGEALFHSVTPPFKFKNMLKQMEGVGVGSLFVVILTGSFTGMVLAMQGYTALKRFGAESLVGPTVALSMARELGPVLTGLMVTGRAGSAMATELGTMRVTEQIDAITTMGLNPVRYLLSPRVIAGAAMLPILTIISDFTGVIGGYLVGVKLLDINSGVYIGRTIDHVDIWDIFNGLLKAFFFGIIISVSACYHGFNTTGGAEGVGRAATRAVVMGCVLILMVDYILTSIMF
ncbi:MAG: ABC transporter permease [Deltaproteobacteria bacterium]|nr:ABC transporter permease [Deltaproteobacteria bacterium]